MARIIPENRPIPPGDYIYEDLLLELNLTQGELAERLGVSRRTINQLVNENRRISADIALRLAQFTQTSPQRWLSVLHF